MIKYITMITLLFLSSCFPHIIKIEGDLTGCWKEGSIWRCGTARSYNSKDGIYKMETSDNWIMSVRQEEITWKK